MTETPPSHTARTLKIAKQIRDLTIGELVALREILKGEWDILPPDIGVREPRRPTPSAGSTGVTATPEEEEDG